MESRRVALGVLLTFLGLTMSAAAYRLGHPDGSIVYWGLLPGAPFVLLATLSLVPRFPYRVLAGASVGGLLAVAIPYGLLFYSSFGGA